MSFITYMIASHKSDNVNINYPLEVNIHIIRIDPTKIHVEKWTHLGKRQLLNDLLK